MYFSALMLSVIGIFFGGVAHTYYYLPLLLYISVPLMAVAASLPQINLSYKRIILFAIVLLCLLPSINSNFTASRLFSVNNAAVHQPGSDEESFPKEFDRPAYFVIADIINQKENPTMLNYGALDQGVYRKAHVLPINFYFQKQNISNANLPQMMDEQNDIVNNKRVNFVLISIGYDAAKGKEIEKLLPQNVLDNYMCVARLSCDDKTLFLLEAKK